MINFFLMYVTTIFLFGFVIGCNNRSTEEQAPVSKTPAPASMNAVIEKYSTVLRENPNDLNALINLGNIFMDTGRYPEAIDHYRKALEIIPGNVNVRIDMGTCYRRIGKPEKTLEEYKKGLSYQPDHPNALANMGVVLAYDLKDIEGALESWERFLKVAPTHPMAEKIRQDIARIKLMEVEK